MLAFTGVRGAESLAAALALPLALPGEGFPYRDMILFVAFGVILITLVGLGSGLPLVVRWLGVAKDSRREYIAEHESEIAARREALHAALKSLDAITDDRDCPTKSSSCCGRGTDPQQPVAGSLDRSPRRLATGTAPDPGIDCRRAKIIHVLLRDGKITDETRRRIERDLDLEEASLSNREYRKIPL